MQAELLVLLKRNELCSQQCELFIGRLEKAILDCVNEQKKLMTQRHSLLDLMDMERVKGVIDKDIFFASRRRIAVIRRQLVEVDLKTSQLLKKIEEIESDKENQIEKRDELNVRTRKYEYFLERERKKIMKIKLTREESDIEELISWRK